MALRCQLYENTVVCIFFANCLAKAHLGDGGLEQMNRLIKLLICFSVNVPRKLLLHAKSEKILGCTLGISCVLYSDNIWCRIVCVSAPLCH